MRLWKRNAPKHTSARDLLELIQETTYRAYGEEPRVYDPAYIEAKVEQVVAAQLADHPPDKRAAMRRELVGLLWERIRRAPKYEDPLRYATLLDLAGEIEHVAELLKVPVPVKPLLGTLPLGQVNALTVLVPGTQEHLVLFEAELFNFALLMSKAVARALPLIDPLDSGQVQFSADPDDIRRRIDSDPTVLMRFADVVLAYVVHGRPGEAAPYDVEPEYWQLCDYLLHAMELFVLGHEYAHVGLGHLSAAASRKAPLPATEAEALAWSWNNEYEADVYGALMAVEAVGGKGIDPAFGYWGSDLCFASMDVVQRAVALLRHGDEEHRSHNRALHPPPHDRHANLRDTLTQTLGEGAGQLLMGPGLAVQETVELLWERTRPMVADYRARGGQAAPIWLD